MLSSLVYSVYFSIIVSLSIRPRSAAFRLRQYLGFHGDLIGNYETHLRALREFHGRRPQGI